MTNTAASIKWSEAQPLTRETLAAAVKALGEQSTAAAVRSKRKELTWWVLHMVADQSRMLHYDIANMTMIIKRSTIMPTAMKNTIIRFIRRFGFPERRYDDTLNKM